MPLSLTTVFADLPVPNQIVVAVVAELTLKGLGVVWGQIPELLRIPEAACGDDLVNVYIRSRRTIHSRFNSGEGPRDDGLPVQ